MSFRDSAMTAFVAEGLSHSTRSRSSSSNRNGISSALIAWGRRKHTHTKHTHTMHLKPTIHDATTNMQFTACNRIASCVLEMLCVACSVKRFHANRIVVYSLQHVARGFKGFNGNAATEHISRRGDYSETQRFYGLASVGTKMAAFSWTVAKIDVLQVRCRRFCRYGEQRTIFMPVRRRPTTSSRPRVPPSRVPPVPRAPRPACPPSHAHVVQFVYYYIYFSCAVSVITTNNYSYACNITANVT